VFIVLAWVENKLKAYSQTVKDVELNAKKKVEHVQSFENIKRNRVLKVKNSSNEWAECLPIAINQTIVKLILNIFDENYERRYFHWS